MRERRPGAAGNTAEAWVLACVLSVPGFGVLLTFLAVDSVSLGGASKGVAGTPAVWWTAALLGVLLVNVFAAAAFGLKRLNWLAWTFGLGLLAMVLSLATAGLRLTGLIGADTFEFLLPGAIPHVAGAVMLLVSGSVGLLISCLALLTGGGNEPVRQGRLGDAGLVLLGFGAFLLVGLPMAWVVYVTRMAGNFSTGSFASAPALFAGFSILALAVIVPALICGREDPERRGGAAVWLPSGTIFLMLMACAFWLVAETGPDSSAFSGGLGLQRVKDVLLDLRSPGPGGLRGEMVGLLLRDSGIARYLAGGFAVLLIYIETSCLVRSRRSLIPHRRLVVLGRWIGSAAAGVIFLYTAVGLLSVARALAKYGPNTTPRDFSEGIEAGAAATCLIPVILASYLFATPRTLVVSAGYRRFRRIGLTILALGTFGFFAAATFWWEDLESIEPVSEAFRWLKIAAWSLGIGAIAFLLCATTAAVLGVRRLDPYNPPANLFRH
jgi:hypothetical protein